MERTFLIAGNPSKLGMDLAQEALSRKHKVLLCTEPDSERAPIPAGLEANLRFVDWNRRSPISARFVILQAINNQMEITNALIYHVPRNPGTAVHELSSSAVEETLDFECKSYLFLLKELVPLLLKKGGGTISFILQNPASETLSPLDGLTSSAFTGLVDALFSQYEQEPISINGISTRLSANRQIAEFVFQSLDEDNRKTRGKWTKYTGKSGLFAFGRS